MNAKGQHASVLKWLWMTEPSRRRCCGVRMNLDEQQRLVATSGAILAAFVCLYTVCACRLRAFAPQAV